MRAFQGSDLTDQGQDAQSAIMARCVALWKNQFACSVSDVVSGADEVVIRAARDFLLYTAHGLFTAERTLYTFREVE